VAAEQSSWQPWHAQTGIAERGNRTGAGEEGRVEVDQAGGGVAVVAQRRLGARYYAGGRRGKTEQHVPEEEEERGGVRRTYMQNEKILGTFR
jgi:hypothetical protein